MTKSRTIRELISAAGGAGPIAEACNQASIRGDKRLTVDAVYKWPSNGIPDRYWVVIIPLAGTTADELLAANDVARSEKVA